MASIRARTRGRAWLAVTVVLIVAALGAVVTGQLWLAGQRATDDREAEVLGAADLAATMVLSYDYRRLQAGFDSTEPLLSGDALAQYDALQEPLLREAPKLQAVVSSSVAGSTVLDSEADAARVLLFVDQTSISTKLDAPQLDQSRIVVTLVRDGDDWLVDTLAAV